MPSEPRSIRSDLVWYVAYGSNCSTDRFDHYRLGGRPAGSTRDHSGFRDPEVIGEPLPTRITHRLYFARESKVWGGGGVAFVATDRSETSTRCVARQLSARQLADLCSQECGGGQAAAELDEAVRSLLADLDAGRLQPGATRILPADGWYGCALVLDPIGDRPAVTLTSAERSTPTRPADVYLDRIRAGLREAGLEDHVVEDYLAVAQRGNIGAD